MCCYATWQRYVLVLFQQLHHHQPRVCCRLFKRATRSTFRDVEGFCCEIIHAWQFWTFLIAELVFSAFHRRSLNDLNRARQIYWPLGTPKAHYKLENIKKGEKGSGLGVCSTCRFGKTAMFGKIPCFSSLKKKINKPLYVLNLVQTRRPRNDCLIVPNSPANPKN